MKPKFSKFFEVSDEGRIFECAWCCCCFYDLWWWSKKLSPLFSLKSFFLPCLCVSIERKFSFDSTSPSTDYKKNGVRKTTTLLLLLTYNTQKEYVAKTHPYTHNHNKTLSLALSLSKEFIDSVSSTQACKGTTHRSSTSCRARCNNPFRPRFDHTFRSHLPRRT